VAGRVPAEAKLLREAFAEFVDFADTVWAAIGLPPLTPRQRESAHFLQHGPSRRFVAAYRGHGKSYLAGAYALWRLFLDPSEQILILSGSNQKAVDTSVWVRNLIENPRLPFLKHLAPREGQRDSKLSWDVGPSPAQQSASFTAMSVGASLQGRRCTLAILDDAEQKNNSASQLQRDNLLRSIMDVEAMLTTTDSAGVLVLGTYQSLSSIYLTMVNERGYEAMVIPCRVPKDAKEYAGRLSPEIQRMYEEGRHGEPTDPDRFSEQVLTVREVGLGPLEWQIQMMLSVAVSDRFAHPLNLSDLVVWDGVNPFGSPKRIIPGRTGDCRLDDLPCAGLPGDAFYAPSVVDQDEVLPYSRVVMAIDPAGNSGQDETAYAVVGAIPGTLTLLASGGFLEGSSTKTMNTLAAIAKRWRVTQFVVESNLVSWPILFRQAVATAYPAEVVEVRATKNKVERMAGALEPVLTAGQLVVARSILEEEHKSALRSKEGPKGRSRMLAYQMAMLRRNEKDGGIPHDDRLDALAWAVSHLAPEYLHTNSALAVERMVARRREQAVRDFIRGCQDPFGKAKEQQPTWVQLRGGERWHR
jgi:hypothetical protein